MASEWRHTDEKDPVDVDGEPGLFICVVPITPGGSLVCGCDRPTPDRASPCGRLLEDDDLPGVERPCGWPVSGIVHSRHHPHQPTRCTCGHPIERTVR